MFYTYKALLISHIAIGFASLVFFWIPVFAKKGSDFHTRSGHWYAKTMYAVGFSALALSLMLMVDPIGFKFNNHEFSDEELPKVVSSVKDTGIFLLAISVLVLVGVRHGLQTIQAKKNHQQMRRWDNLSINFLLLSVGVWLGFIATGNSPMSVLFYVFAFICVITSVGNLRFCFKQNVKRTEQIIAHLSSIIGAGIGSHTAFFVFGASRVFAELLTGYVAIVPWVLPAVIGNVIIWQQAKRYKPRKTARQVAKV
ncbi:hypothetical protein NBRC116583_05670 [Arenicella sp. 4NH20-0111]|uniref:hypothetical protein n=1 Tax=Arenicella sp. 4NH20-0111 TaxID=3127648 RepID=UPI003108FCA1